MTKDELWNLYVDRNPAFEGEANVTMTTAGIRKLFDQTWDISFKSGLEKGKVSGDNLYNQMFGGFK